MTSGKVVEVVVEYAGTTVEGDHSSGATVLNVADVLDFDEDGGRLSIDYDDGAVEYDYLGLDDETPRIALGQPLADPVDDDTAIHLIPLAPEVTASVALGVETGDTIEGVIVPHALRPLLPEGIRDPEAAESVELESLGAGEWAIKDVVGRETQIDTSDTTIATAPSGLRTQLDAIGLRTFNADETETARLSAETGGMRLGGGLIVDGQIRNPHSSEPVDMVHEDGEIKLVRRGDNSVIARIRYAVFGGKEALAIGGPETKSVFTEAGEQLSFHVQDGEMFFTGGPTAGPINFGDPVAGGLRPPVRFYSDVYFTTFPGGGNLFVPTPTDDHHAANKAYVDANAGGGGAEVAYITVMLDSGDQSIVNGVSNSTTIQWQSTQDAENLTWNYAGNRFLADPDTAGLFEVTANIAWRGSSSGTRYLTVTKNGTNINQSRTNPPASGVFTQHLTSVPIRLAAGDWIDFRVSQSSGGNLGLVGNGDYLTKATVKRIGD